MPAPDSPLPCSWGRGRGWGPPGEVTKHAMNRDVGGQKDISMRYRGARFLRPFIRVVLPTLLLLWGAAMVLAQLPPIQFDGADWLMDRGNFGAFLGPGGQNLNGTPLRLGYNNFTDPVNSPGPGAPRWV